MMYGKKEKCPQRIIKTALEENVNLIGLSFLEGKHIFFVPQILSALKDEGLQSVKLVVGSVIPPDHVAHLKDMGVQAVFHREPLGKRL